MWFVMVDLGVSKVVVRGGRHVSSLRMSGNQKPFLAVMKEILG